MGDRFNLKLSCIFCTAVSDVYYAPTCCMYDFTCTACKKINFVCADFRVKKAEDVTEDDAVQAFEMATTGNHTLAAIRKEAKRYLKDLKKRIKEGK